VVAGGGNQRRAHPLKEEQIGEQADKPQQGQGDKCTKDSNHGCQQGDGNHLPGSGEIAQALGAVPRPSRFEPLLDGLA
jgi:hypothetical protein